MAASLKDSDTSGGRLRGNDVPKIPLQVIGAGPAGMGMVLALCNRVAAADANAALAQDLLDHLVMFEASREMGGKMGHYRINANTSAHDVVQGIGDGTPFTAVRDEYLAHPQTQSELIALPRIQSLMVEPLVRSMHKFLGQRLQCGVDIARIEIIENGFASYDRENRLRASTANLLFCCGAFETPLMELESMRDRWEGSMNFLLRDKLDGLQNSRRPIVIIGASHSAFSCAWRLLYDPLFSEFARDREIVILQRCEHIKLRCTPDFAAAHQIGYDPQTDVCPGTGLVFFHGGLRKDAKFLYLNIRDGQENRVRIVQMEELGEQQDLLDQAGLILQATGFVARLPLIQKDGAAVRVGHVTRGGELRNLDNGEIIPGLFGMGLGLNILPDGAPRGEPSFDGGIHGFQSYPLAIAPGIIDRLMANMPLEISF